MQKYEFKSKLLLLDEYVLDYRKTSDIKYYNKIVNLLKQLISSALKATYFYGVYYGYDISDFIAQDIFTPRKSSGKSLFSTSLEKFDTFYDRNFFYYVYTMVKIRLPTYLKDYFKNNLTSRRFEIIDKLIEIYNDKKISYKENNIKRDIPLEYLSYNETYDFCEYSKLELTKIFENFKNFHYTYYKLFVILYIIRPFFTMQELGIVLNKNYRTLNTKKYRSLKMLSGIICSSLDKSSIDIDDFIIMINQNDLFFSKSDLYIFEGWRFELAFDLSMNRLPYNVIRDKYNDIELNELFKNIQIIFNKLVKMITAKLSNHKGELNFYERHCNI